MKALAIIVNVVFFLVVIQSAVSYGLEYDQVTPTAWPPESSSLAENQNESIESPVNEIVVDDENLKQKEMEAEIQNEIERENQERALAQSKLPIQSPPSSTSPQSNLTLRQRKELWDQHLINNSSVPSQVDHRLVFSFVSATEVIPTLLLEYLKDKYFNPVRKQSEKMIELGQKILALESQIQAQGSNPIGRHLSADIHEVDDELYRQQLGYEKQKRKLVYEQRNSLFGYGAKFVSGISNVIVRGTMIIVVADLAAAGYVTFVLDREPKVFTLFESGRRYLGDPSDIIRRALKKSGTLLLKFSDDVPDLTLPPNRPKN